MRVLTVSTARVAALAVLVALVAGCTTSDPESKASRSVKSPEVDLTEACPGLITDAAGEALMHVLQSSDLVNDDAQTVGVTAMGKALEETYRAGAKVREFTAPVCTVTGIVGSGRRVGEIRVAAESGNAGTPGTARTGVRVTRADKERGVAFDCVSTRVGSTHDMPLRITALYTDQYQNSKGDAALGEDYLVLAHSAARAIAKESRCENNGGLPDGAAALPRS
ncbi:hypothetical protein J7E97_00980 [Streptomyces sp. ISL-66]|uniref:hypothetical protein n=1 Tax=Streptomyces sp. ISL-66 TaxID=2819186 RepID=UPI001BEBAA44|nr:hypothetical protein [Streptomyces sp. ISL-66]MBT2466470.1 hypothetical protein [Streptomyces sp. ISL-66]